MHPLPLLDRQAVWARFFIEVPEIVFLHLPEFEHALVNQVLFPAAVVKVKDRAGGKISIGPAKRLFPALAKSARELAVRRCIELAFIRNARQSVGPPARHSRNAWPKDWQRRQRAGGRREMPGAMPGCRQPRG